MKFPRYLPFVNKSFLLLLLYIFLSAVMMSFSDTGSLKGVRWGLLQVVEFTDAVKHRLHMRTNLEKQNNLLIEENFNLHINNQQLREMALENARLKKLLKLKRSSPHDFVAAHVIGAGTENLLGTIILDCGENDGVTENMAVINAEGLVGKTISTTPDQSVVEILMDQNTFVSARLEKSREVGSVGWSGGLYLNLLYISKIAKIGPGEGVVTSGLSDIYPPGIRIGAVRTVTSSERDLFMRITVAPAVNFNALEEVFVIRNKKSETAGSD